MATLVIPDNDLQQDVLEEFVYDPAVQIADIGVQVDAGVVTLTGTVESSLMKVAAEHAALRVAGVRAVANDLAVRTPRTYNDTDIAKSVVAALEAHVALPPDQLDVTVQNGKVTLRGEVDWPYQRATAAASVRSLRGVRDVRNLIQVKRQPVPSTAVAAEIERALLRAAAVDAHRIQVHTEDGQVHLTGTVRSWAEKEAAGFAAWRATGVTEGTNDLEVRPN